jgi:hypothetical protein
MIAKFSYLNSLLFRWPKSIWNLIRPLSRFGFEVHLIGYCARFSAELKCGELPSDAWVAGERKLFSRCLRAAKLKLLLQDSFTTEAARGVGHPASGFGKESGKMAQPE